MYMRSYRDTRVIIELFTVVITLKYVIMIVKRSQSS